jgi:hypothetical protein
MTGGGHRNASGRRKGTELGYEFTPTPRAAIRAVEEGLLDHLDYVILSALYERWFRGQAFVRFTLEQLRVWTCWAYTPDALSKRLRDLREKGWVSYQQPRKRPHRYEAKLNPEPSERGPSQNAPSRAEAAGRRSRTDPSRELSHPSDGTDGIAVSEPASKTLSHKIGPSASDAHSNPSSLEEAIVQTSPRTSRAREQGEGPTGDPIADEIPMQRSEHAPWARELPPGEQQIVRDSYELLDARERKSVQPSPHPPPNERNSTNG